MIHQGPAIVLHRLHRFFGSTRAVDDVSFEVYRGQVFGYIGPNGAGKTTSMRILATLDMPTAGDAWVDGFSVVNDPDRVRRRIGFMPDYFGTYTNVNCREYLDFFARAYGLAGHERRLAIDRTMAFTGLDVLAHKSIDGLSKGMKQRLCLGRALVHDPTVLILDEPAAGLDPRARIELREMIGRLAEEGKTVLVSSHILTELAEMCDTVGIIEQGRLLAVGSVDEIRQAHRRRLAAERAHEAEAHRTTVRVQLAEPAPHFSEWLARQDEVVDVRAMRETIVFSHRGDRALAAELLRRMVLAEFRVAEFATQDDTLEHVFLEVTKGRVQ